jgi:hypothetical protein
MILHRIINHLKSQHWTKVFIDLVIVVLGVFIGLQVDNWNQMRQQKQHAAQLLNTLGTSMRHFDHTTAEMSKRITEGFAAFHQARARGEHPPPFFFRIPGSDTPPIAAWQAALQSNLAELLPPRLMFDVGFFYSEQQGVGAKYVRYSEFVDREILPRLGNPASFYDASGTLKPIYAQNMQRLREWNAYQKVLVTSSRCLRKRFVHPMRAGKSCRPDYSVLKHMLRTP